MSVIDERRLDCAVGVLGGPTTVLDIAGRRLVVDPTFDPPGDYGYLRKLRGPAVSERALGPVDAVLISHDDHPDNLDRRGREFALAAPLVLTGPGAAGRLGPPARGLAAWQTATLPAGPAGPELRVQAVPAVHGPADGAQDAEGNVNCAVTGFVVSGDRVPTVYLSGDNASISTLTEIAARVGPIDIAVLFAGAARVPSKERSRPLTLTGARAAAAAELLGVGTVVPAHYDGWAHFSEGLDEIVTAFEEAGIAAVLRAAPLGEWTVPTP